MSIQWDIRWFIFKELTRNVRGKGRKMEAELSELLKLMTEEEKEELLILLFEKVYNG